MFATHSVTLNGNVDMDVLGTMLPVEKEVRRGLEILNGERNFSYSLWRRTDGVVRRSEECIQSAGSASGMTVEIRRVEENGMAYLYAVSRLSENTAGLPLAPILWDEATMTIPSNEVFDANEAGDIYWYYYQHDTVPPGYLLRELESWPASF